MLPRFSLRLLVLLILCPAAGAVAQPVDASRPPASSDPLARLTPWQQDEVLWLARCIYSESDRDDERRLVAWVVRNRVETGFRGDTYREVVLEPRQFSTFNTPSARRTRILAFDGHSQLPSWRQALQIAREVYEAPPSARPFSLSTRHFYSPVSMEGRRRPAWTVGFEPLSSAALGVDPVRFQFYDGIDEDLHAAEATVPASAPHPTGARSGTGTHTPQPGAQQPNTRRMTAGERLRQRMGRSRIARPIRPGRTQPHRSRSGSDGT